MSTAASCRQRPGKGPGPQAAREGRPPQAAREGRPPQAVREGRPGGGPLGGSGRQPRPLPGDVGSATAETAVVLPAVVVVLAMCLWGLSAGLAQLRCVDGARAAARELARGESPESARQAARTAAPGARVAFESAGDLVRVTVRLRVRTVVPALPQALDVEVGSRMVTRREPGVEAVSAGRAAGAPGGGTP